MCFFSRQSKSATELQNRFNATFDEADKHIPSSYNGFQFPKTPVITDRQTDKIQLYNWGLVPHWANDISIRKNTLNCRRETMFQKPSFRDCVNQRCLVLVDGFYEWQWLDEKGKDKQKYLITLQNGDAFALAGLWSEWIDGNSGQVIHSYTILTTVANEFMSRIHNKGGRMPYIVGRDGEQDWLLGKDLANCEYTLEAIKC